MIHPTGRIWWLACLFSIVLPAVASCISEEAEGDDGDIVRIGQPVPDFVVALSDGTEISSAMLAGQPAVIAFFNTGCSDCRKELPTVQRLFDELGRQVRFICIGREESAESVRAYWERNNLSLPYSAQPDRAIYGKFARHTIPRLYVTDATGTIRAAFTGKASYKQLKAAVEKAMPPQTTP